VLGKTAADHTGRMKAVQQLLGEHQDSVMCGVALDEAAGQAREAGEDLAPYLAMRRREREIAADIEARLPRAWQSADRDI
jgi:CHAD domain-containing protein